MKVLSKKRKNGDEDLIITDMLLDILNSTDIYSTEWTLANYFLHSANNLKNIPIQTAADDCHVSEATVSRFIKRIGYNNYAELRNSYMYSKNVNDLRVFNMNKESFSLLNNRPEQFLEEYKNEINQTLSNTTKSLDLKKIDAFLKEIKEQNNIFIFGINTSKMFADIIQYNLINYGKTIYVGNTLDQQYNFAQNLQGSDLAIVISTFGNFLHEYSPLMSTIYDSNCKTILITQNTGIQETYFFDYVIYFSDSNNTETGTYSMLLGIEYLVRRYSTLLNKDNS